MIKPTTFMCLILLSTLSFAVFQIEDHVENLRSELKEINRQVRNDRDSINVLNAEWSYLTQPERLTELSDNYLELEYITADNVIDIEKIPLRSFVVSDNVAATR